VARRACGTCGHGATSKLLSNLKDSPEPLKTKRKPPKKKSNQEKAQILAAAILRGIYQ
jgi:hypothetical protein